MKRRVIAIIIVFSALGVSAAIYMYQKPPEKVVSSRADFTVDATELFAEFDKSEAQANQKYLNKIVTVKGTVADVSAVDSLGVNLILATGNPLFGISCQLPSGVPGNGIKDGEQVTVTGLCTGKLMDVVLVKCRLENQN